MNSTIRVSGTRSDILALKSELEEKIEQGITVSKPESYIGGLGSRQTYRQNEIVEIVINIATGVASSIVYDQVKYLIAMYQRTKKVDVLSENEEDEETSDPDESDDANI